MDNTIYIAKYLTSTRFYEEFLQAWNEVEEFHSSEYPIVLDFSNTNKLEPLCIPNILILGNNIQEKTGVPVNIFIPDTVEGGSLKFYLWKMGFLANSIIMKNGKKERTIFNYETSPYGGADGTNIDPVCGTFYFEAGMEEAVIENAVYNYLEPFADKYLYRFQIDERDNIITRFLAETVKNSVIHGDSNAYVSLHGRHSDRKIYISVSDFGKGFCASWCEKKAKLEEKIKSGIAFSQEDEIEYQDILDTEKEHNDHRTPSNEREAIICGMYKRRKSKIYGLYNVICHILKKGIALKKNANDKRAGAIIRIHSNDTQIIITERLINQFENGELKKVLNLSRYNVKEQYSFQGAHIEIEIPFM